MESFAWILSILMLAVGFIGALLPGIPGIPLMLAGVVIHKLLLPDVLSWWTVAIFSLTALIALGLDFAATIWTSRLAGATKSGIIGALVGGFIGLFFGLPGLLIGPFLGAALGELIVARRGLIQAIKSGGGAALGLLAGTVGKGLLAFFLLVWFAMDAWVF